MLKPIKKRKMLGADTPKETPKEEKKNKTSKSKLPPDEYKDEIEPIDIYVDETRKFVISVKRGGELGLPMCDLRQFQTTDLYSGFTKKGINLPIELLPDLIEVLQTAYEQCEEKGLLED